MLELKKEQERKAAAKRKAVRRGFAVAAIIALVIAVTPLRGYVASAAEDAYEAFHSWIEELFELDEIKLLPENYNVDEEDDGLIITSRTIDVGSFNKSIIVSDFNIEFQNFTIIDATIADNICLDNDFHPETNITVKINHIGNSDGFGKYTPNYLLNFTVAVEKDSQILFSINFAPDGYYYGATSYDSFGNLISDPAFVVNESYQKYGICDISYNMDNIKKYLETDELLDEIGYNLFNIIETIKPDKYIITNIGLETQKASKVEISTQEPTDKNTDIYMFSTNKGIIYEIISDPKTVVYNLVNIDYCSSNNINDSEYQYLIDDVAIMK